MKKINLLMIISIVILLVGCVQIPSQVKNLNVNWPDEKPFIYNSDDIDISNITVEIEYLNGDIDTLRLKDVSLQGNGLIIDGAGEDKTVKLDMSNLGEFYIRISYGGVSVTLYYTVFYTGLQNKDYAFNMVQVGTPDETHTIPTGIDDSGTATVEGGYLMATTETTYELWYEVRIWAEASGYHFQNLGREGDGGTIGAAPTEAILEPVTTVSWRDVIVWTNALSEMTELDPVYRTAEGIIINDARDSNGSQVDGAIQTDNNGYRLPTSNEWEMAARWKNDTISTDGSILVSGRYWTPGNYASGATAGITDETATSAVSWYSNNSDTGTGQKTHSVALKNANMLGIYDMSGNIEEWCFDGDDLVGGRYTKGGSYATNSNIVQVGCSWIASPVDTLPLGFRIVR
jgi:hypothetical protein